MALGISDLLYALVVLLVLTGYLAVWLLLVFLAIPEARQAIAMLRRPKPDSPPPGYPEGAWPLWFVGSTFVHNRSFGTMFMLGLILDVVLRAWGLTRTLILPWTPF